MTKEQIQERIDGLKLTYLGEDEEKKVKILLTALNNSSGGGGGGGGGAWGEIIGTLSDQEDLQSALDLLQSQINAITAVGNKLFNYYNFI